MTKKPDMLEFAKEEQQKSVALQKEIVESSFVGCGGRFNRNDKRRARIIGIIITVVCSAFLLAIYTYLARRVDKCEAQKAQLIKEIGDSK